MKNWILNDWLLGTPSLVVNVTVKFCATPVAVDAVLEIVPLLLIVTPVGHVPDAANVTPEAPSAERRGVPFTTSAFSDGDNGVSRAPMRTVIVAVELVLPPPDIVNVTVLTPAAADGHVSEH